jgi:hypothetical protein
VRPELGPGGRSIELRARRPDGSVDVLLWIREFRQDWQTPYVFRRPVALPAGTVIQATASFEPAGPAEPAGGGPRAPAFSVTLTAFDSF